MTRGNGAALDAWIAASWDNPPNWTRSAFKEMYEHEVRETAQAEAATVEAQKLARLEAENVDLQHRVARLEQLLGKDGRRLQQPVVAAIGDALPQVLERHLEHHKVMVDRGIWDRTKAYKPGHCVTDRGSIWTCIEPAAPGERPGKGPPWRLAVKSETRKEPVAR